MSAECNVCGADLLHDGTCPECELLERLRNLTHAVSEVLCIGENAHGEFIVTQRSDVVSPDGFMAAWDKMRDACEEELRLQNAD